MLQGERPLENLQPAGFASRAIVSSPARLTPLVIAAFSSSMLAALPESSTEKRSPTTMLYSPLPLLESQRSWIMRPSAR